jgi:hypothetical protein
MRYLVLLVADGELPAWSDHTEQQQADAMQRFAAFDAACDARDGV